MEIEVITSFNQKYYDRIGRDCVKSYLKHWSTPLTIYAEDCEPINDKRLTVIDFDQLGDTYFEFQQDLSVSARCKTFAKKAFSTIHAMHHSQAHWLVWLDADVLTTKSDPAQELYKILDRDALAMYMGVRYTEHRDRKKGDWLVPETGLFAINLKHHLTSRFRDRYEARYVRRDFADLRRSYDNDVFGAVISSIAASYIDLCQPLKKPYKTPLKHTIFGQYLHHYKAKHSKKHYEDNQ